jgi:hydroxymethylpyrimidine/phosphomethylpyrimidine kinase
MPGGAVTLPLALTIAGSDSSGGAGIEADLRTFALLGVHGCAVITAVTAQNTRGVIRIEPMSAEIIEAQLLAIFQDLRITSAKTGMLGSLEVIERILAILKRYQPPFLVVDPVMVAQSGDPLIPDEGKKGLLSLMRFATLSTPNLYEARELLGEEIAGDPASLERAGKALFRLLRRPVLLKGGHLVGRYSADLLVLSPEEQIWLRSLRVRIPRTHGTGCHLSSAITAFLARGIPLREAVIRSKRWITRALRRAQPIGRGGVPPCPLPLRKG